MSCLFEMWQAESTGVFHTSTFWPAFDEKSIGVFLDGSGDAPTLTRQFDEIALMKAIETVESFLRKIEPLDEHEYICKQAYSAFEQERLQLLFLMKEANKDSTVSMYNDNLYGSLASLRATEALGYLKAHVEAIEPASERVASAQERLMQAWSHVQSNLSLADVFDALDVYRVQLRPFVDRNFYFVPALVDGYREAIISSQAVSEILNTSLREVFGADMAGWQALLKEGAPNVFIDYDSRSITIPAARSYTKEHVKALIIHEIGVHVVRAVNGDASQERLASIGMVGYGPAEEALGVLMQHAPKESFNQIQSLVCMAVVDFAEHVPERTFREVHNLTTDLLMCLANPNLTTANQTDYRRMAFSKVSRVLRLATNRVVDRSTTKYWRGLLLLEEYFKVHPINDDMLKVFFAGKYDPHDSTQYHLVTEHSPTNTRQG